MRHDRIREAAAREPGFEPPPRLPAGAERRLAHRAAAAFDEGDTHPFRDNALRLFRGPDGIAAAAVGATVQASFGLAAGPLRGGPETLAGVLGAAFERAEGSGAVTPFEAAVETQAAACVLLRGVLLPTSDGVEAVLSWKQVLDADATALLRAELLRAWLPTPPRRVPHAFD